jgi:hypothetical protein
MRRAARIRKQQAVDARIALSESDRNAIDEEVEAGQANLDILTGHPTKAGLSEIDTHWPLFLRATARPWSEANDPRVRAAHQSVTVATEQDHLAAHSYMPNPEIGVGVINQGERRFAGGNTGHRPQDADPSDVTSVPVRTPLRVRFPPPSGRKIATQEDRQGRDGARPGTSEKHIGLDRQHGSGRARDACARGRHGAVVAIR